MLKAFKIFMISLCLMNCVSVAKAESNPEMEAKMGEAMQILMDMNPHLSMVEVCYENVGCYTYAHVDIRKGGTPEVVYQKPKANDTGADIAKTVGDIAGAIGAQTGFGGRIIIDYEKKPDGSFKVHVEIAAGVGSGAAGAAGGSGGGGGGHPAAQN